MRTITRMFAVHLLSLSLVVTICSSCAPPSAQVSSAPSSAGNSAQVGSDLYLRDDVIADLMNKAGKVAMAELERFNATQEVYKDKVGLHMTPFNPLAEESGMFLKTYQTYDSYEVIDLLRTESFLYPVEYVIQYTYSFYHTLPHHTTELNQFLDIDPKRLAEAETEFTKDGDHTFARRYLADRDGKVREDQFRPIMNHHYYHGMVLSDGVVSPATYANPPTPILYEEEVSMAPGQLPPSGVSGAQAAPGALSGEIVLTPEIIESMKQRAIEESAKQ